MTAYLVGCDLAQSSDYTALSVAEVVPTDPQRRDAGNAYRVGHLERIRGRSYLDVAARVRDLVAALRQPPPWPAPATAEDRVLQHEDRLRLARGEAPRFAPKPATVTVVYDKTGVGAAVGDVFDRAKIDARLVGVVLHGGDRVSREGAAYRAPKRDVVAALVVGFQNGTVRIAADLPLAPVLSAELANFKLKLNPETMHDSYSSWREDEHDDLVLSLGLLVWFGGRLKRAPAVAAAGIARPSPWGGQGAAYDLPLGRRDW